MTSPLTTTGGRLAVPVDDRDHVLGRGDAPVTLVEYGDYQCPYCARAHTVVQELLRHSSIKVTMDIYTQAVTGTKRKAQSRVIEMIAPKKKAEAVAPA